MTSVMLERIRSEVKRRGIVGSCVTTIARIVRYRRTLNELKDDSSEKTDTSLLAFAKACAGGWFEPTQIDSEILSLMALVRELQPRSILEIGTYNGGTLLLFARLAALDAKIVSVDLPGGAFGGGYPFWRGPLYRRFAKPSQEVVLIRGDSHTAETRERVARIFGHESIDFLFIDGDHTYEGAKKDYQLYSPFVREGGLIALHDVNESTDSDTQVCRLWTEIKKTRPTEEFIAGPRDFGIGVIRVQ